MKNKIENLIDSIYMKLKNNYSRKIYLEKGELRKFISFLVNNR